MKYLVTVPKQFVDQSGIPYSGGTVSVYESGKMELAEIFENASGSELCDNPATLDSNGMWQAFVTADELLDYVVRDADGNVIASYMDVSVPAGEGGGQSGVTKKYVDDQDDELRDSIDSVADDLQSESDRAQAAETEAKSTVSAGTDITVTPTVKPDGHTDYQVDFSGQRGVEITSPKDTVDISKTRDPITGMDVFRIDIKNIVGDYINTAYDGTAGLYSTATLSDDTAVYVPLADYELSRVIGSNNIELQDSDDVHNCIASMDANKKFICTAQVKVTVVTSSSDKVNIDVKLKVGHMKWFAGTFNVDTTEELVTSKTFAWMTENTDSTAIMMALSDEQSGAVVEVEVIQLFITEFSPISSNGGEGASYVPGNAIEITSGNVISVLHGFGLDVDVETNELIVSQDIIDLINNKQDALTEMTLSEVQEIVATFI